MNMKFTESDTTSKAFDEIYSGNIFQKNENNLLYNMLNRIETTSRRWTANHLELPEVPYNPGNHTIEFQNEYTRIYKIIRTCLIDELYKRLGNSFDEVRSIYVCANRDSDRNNSNNIIPDVYNHRKQIIKLQEDNNFLIETNEMHGKNIEDLHNRLFHLEKRVIFLSERNILLEQLCISTSKYEYASTIQRYWRKYKLLKRIKEASNIYRLTKNFTNFVKPINILNSI